VLVLDPNDGEALIARGFMRAATKDEAGALADADNAARVIAPTSLERQMVVNLYERLGQPERALPLLDALIASHREDSRLGSLLNSRCWLRALANRELAGGLDDCNRAIKLEHAPPAILDSRGLLHLRQGAFTAAIADYDAALKLRPGQGWSLYGRGLAKRALGQDEGAKADLAAAKAAQPGIAEDAARYGIGP
jgi:tetratricopeptide (TPR) repeat protein